MKKIAVLLSGGVDSSVALALLQEQHENIEAFYIKIWLEEEFAHLGECPFEEDIFYAESVCKKLNIPFHIVSLQREYWNTVVSYVLSEITKGRTPNPDIMCNSAIKFLAFQNAISKDFTHIASGHYASLEKKNGISFLRLSKDKKKDQSYFLSRLSQDQLKKCVFPLGNLTKSEVRKKAEELALPNAHRKDSQGICFLGKIPYTEFLKKNIGEKKGEIKEYESNKVLGKHLGAYLYTLGQRQGIGLSGGPFYVVEKDITHNIVYVSREYHKIETHKKECIIEDILSPISLEENTVYDIKVRHGEEFHKGSLEYLSPSSAKVTLHTLDHSLTPGQFLVFYKDELCWGSGVIK
jgi:tRNA-specific 2-thiouridylase